MTGSVCYLSVTNGNAYKTCLFCNIDAQISSADEIIANSDCQPVFDLHCSILQFESIESYKNFTMRFVDIINQLFDKQDTTNVKKTNMLTIRIENGIFDQFSLDTFRWLDQVVNRTYCCLQFQLSSPGRQVPLPLNPNIQNMTLFTIQINVDCHSTGSQYYTYQSQGNHQLLVEQLTCKLPDGTTSIVTSEKRTTAVLTNTLRSTKKPPEKLVLIVGLVGGASVLPCLLFAGCIYILCKRNHQQHEAEKSQIESVWSDETASVASAYSYS